MKGQPIETAPKDGTWIIAWGDSLPPTPCLFLKGSGYPNRFITVVPNWATGHAKKALNENKITYWRPIATEINKGGNNNADN